MQVWTVLHFSPPGGGVRTWQRASSSLIGGVSTLTSVRVSLFGPGWTWSEGKLALHGRLGFPFLPQQLTPVQLRSFGERRQLVFALSQLRTNTNLKKRTKTKSDMSETAKVWLVCMKATQVEVLPVNKLQQLHSESSSLTKTEPSVQTDQSFCKHFIFYYRQSNDFATYFYRFD